MDGEDLERFSKNGEDLVAVYHVQIFHPYEKRLYPYSFGGPEDPPKYLSEMNIANQSFKRVIAWDDNSMEQNPYGKDLEKTGVQVNGAEVVESAIRPRKQHDFTSKKGIADHEEIIHSSRREMRAVRDYFGRAQSSKKSSIFMVPSNENSILPSKRPRESESSAGFCQGARRALHTSSPRGDHTNAENLIDRRDGISSVPSNQLLLLPSGAELSSEEDDVSLPHSSVCKSESHSGAADVTNLDSNDIIFESSASATTAERDHLRSDADEAADEEDSQAMDAIDELFKEFIEECSPEEVEWRRFALTEKRRKYTYCNRKKAPSKCHSSLRKRRLMLSKREDNPFLMPRSCCQRWLCFSTVDPEVAFSFYKKVFSLDQNARKGQILRIYDWKSKTFHLDVGPVCATYLDKGFSISRCLQSGINGTRCAKSTRLPFRVPRETRRKTMEDRIINYLRLLAGQDRQHMPHETRTSLPFPRRGDVYDGFVDFLSRGDEDGDVLGPPSRPYFNRVWKKHVPHVTVRKHHDFTVCARCEWLRSQMVQCFRKRADKLMHRLKEELREHIAAMKAERRAYDERKMLAINHPTQYCSLVVDGADQKNYGLPHFMYSVKTDRGHSIKLKCVDVLERLKKKSVAVHNDKGIRKRCQPCHRMYSQSPRQKENDE